MGRPGASEGSVDDRGQPGQLMAICTAHGHVHCPQPSDHGHVDCSPQYQASHSIYTARGHPQDPQPPTVTSVIYKAHSRLHCPRPSTLPRLAPGLPLSSTLPTAINTENKSARLAKSRLHCPRPSIATDIYTAQDRTKHPRPSIAHGHLH